MQKLITVIGASGVGKTTLVRALAATEKFATAYEEHDERPFQALFKQDKKYALANQLDYLLLRAEQEKELRAASRIGLMDGGLDLDFYGFTRLFHHLGLLTHPEFDLCRRFYLHTRELLPAPEFVINLRAAPEIVARRLASRNRINIASAEDAGMLDQYISEWLASIPQGRVLSLDVTSENEFYSNTTQSVLEFAGLG
jgi:deoxyadenosine/deoxycytidine kinase